MEAMIANTKHGKWLMPLVRFRDRLDVKNDKGMRDFRRMSGRVQLFHDDTIHGPYLQSTREILLKALLETEIEVNQKAPKGLEPISLISMNELRSIRRIWLTEKHEIEDNLPKIFKQVTGKEFPDSALHQHHCFGPEELEILMQVCGDDSLGYEMLRELVDIEWNYRTKLRRAGLQKDIEKAIVKSFYEDKEDALNVARATNKSKSRLEVTTSDSK